LISKKLIVAVSEGQVSSDLANEVAILDLKSGMYYGLNEVGASIWQCISEPKIVGEVYEALLEEYEVEPERLEKDLMEVLQQLADYGLIEVRDGMGD
jgi:hypothetical protein